MRVDLDYVDRTIEPKPEFRFAIKFVAVFGSAMIVLFTWLWLSQQWMVAKGIFNAPSPASFIFVGLPAIAGVSLFSLSLAHLIIRISNRGLSGIVAALIAGVALASFVFEWRCFLVADEYFP